MNGEYVSDSVNKHVSVCMKNLFNSIAMNTEKSRKEIFPTWRRES